MQYFGGNAVFVFAIVLLLLWLVVACGMQAPAAVRTRLYHLPEMDEAAAAAFAAAVWRNCRACAK